MGSSIKGRERVWVELLKSCVLHKKNCKEKGKEESRVRKVWFYMTGLLQMHILCIHSQEFPKAYDCLMPLPKPVPVKMVTVKDRNFYNSGCYASGKTDLNKKPVGFILLSTI